MVKSDYVAKRQAFFTAHPELENDFQLMCDNHFKEYLTEKPGQPYSHAEKEEALLDRFAKDHGLELA